MGSTGDLKERIKKYALQIGIDKIGFTDARPLYDHLPRLEKRARVGYKHGINEGDPAVRIDPSQHLPGANSVISAAIAYPWDEKSQPEDMQARGRISVISRGIDYHVVVRNRLEKLRKYILETQPRAKVVIMVDKEPILEKALAVKAGLGWFGKNSLLVTPEYGSWVCLGELITDLILPPDIPASNGCGSCRKCLDSCPAGALQEESGLNPDRCLACLTLGKSLPPVQVREAIDNRIYGCDTCQSACPYNRYTKDRYLPEFRCAREDAFPLLKELLNMTNAEFKSRFGMSSGAWRGRTSWQRNAVIAAGNLQDAELVPDLVHILEYDRRPVLRGVAAWSLGKIGSTACLEALKNFMQTENDPAVQAEIETAIRTMTAHKKG